MEGEQHRRGLRHLSYNMDLTPGMLIKPPAFSPDLVSDHVKMVVDEQLRMGSDIVISPYYYIERLSSDMVEANFTVWKEVNEYIKSAGMQNEIYYGLLLAEDLIMSEEDIKNLALIVSNQNFAKHIYLKLESVRANSQQMTNSTYLTNLKTFISLLSKS